MDRTQIAIDFASALLANEPEKFEGGSPDRQAWLTLVLDCMQSLYATLGSEYAKIFVDRLLED